ncbi:MAG: protein-L-isoaspartate O-methyltransferase [Hirschia sp.]|nr:protein-L-isoaspartate O-methyltransferase [Hirschia sp.]MBF18249.1 protein-L-isoaspartate O-methyltransferase [Hirschia sp.]
MYDVAARQTMLDTQVRPSDVTDRRIHAALMQIPREEFLPKSRHALANAEVEHKTSDGRYMWRPRDFAKLLQAVQIRPEDEVLDIASGSGYTAAILSQLAAVVVGLESDEAVVNAASERLNSLDIDNADVVAGKLEEGLPSQAPFDVIFINGSVERVPAAWIDQLKTGGRLAVVVREGRASRARIYVKTGDTASFNNVFDATPPALPGFSVPKTFAL